MVGWRHQLNGQEFEQAPGEGEGQGGRVCGRPWDWDMTERLNNISLGVRPMLTSLGTGSPADGFPGVFAEGTGLRMQSGGGKTELRGTTFRSADNCGHSMNRWLRHLGTQESSSRTTLAIAPLGQTLLKWNSPASLPTPSRLRASFYPKHQPREETPARQRLAP